MVLVPLLKRKKELKSPLEKKILHYSQPNTFDSPKGHEVIVSPTIQTKNYKDFCPTIHTNKDCSTFLVILW